MPSSAQVGYAAFQDGMTFNGLLGRTNLIAALHYNNSSPGVQGGIMPSGGGMPVAPGSGMSIVVGTGYCICPSSAGSSSGGYMFGVLTPETLTVATSDPTNPRIDMVAANVVDPGTSAGFAEVQVISGTPTSGATLSNLDGAPAAPSNSIILAYILVPATSTSVISGNIGTVAGFTAAQGGIIPIDAPAATPAGYTGMYVHDLVSGRLAHNPSGTIQQPHVLPFAPQYAVSAGGGGPITSGNLTLLSVTVTTDGNTDIEIIGFWGECAFSNANGGLNLILEIDGSEVTAIGQPGVYGAADSGPGGVIWHMTRSGVDRPAAGTHTITFVLQWAGGGSSSVSVQGPLKLYVRAAPL